MKKIFNVFTICIIISILLISCSEHRNIDVQHHGSMRIIEFEYKEHSYIEFYDFVVSEMIVLHNPDCKCFQHMN